MIRVVLWDLGGVLCGFDADRRLQMIAERCDRRPDEVASVLNPELLHKLDLGAMSGPELLSLFQHRLGWRGTYRELGEAWATAFEPTEEVLALAWRLAGVDHALLSDNGPPLLDQFDVLLPTVATLVPRRFWSANLGAAKPDPIVFAAVEGKLNRAGSEVMFIDDDPANVRAARAAGLHSILFESAERLRIELEAQTKERS